MIRINKFTLLIPSFKSGSGVSRVKISISFFFSKQVINYIQSTRSRTLISKPASICTDSLQGIKEIRPPIAQEFNFGFALPLDPIVSLASQPLRVLTPEQRLRDDAPAQQPKHQVRQHDAVSREETRGLLGKVDVAADDAVEVAPTDDEAQRDAALVHAFEVVGRPSDGVGDARVDSEGAEESACVLDAGSFGAQQHGESDDAEEGDEDVAEPASAGAIGDETDDDRQDGGCGVRGHAEKVCLGGFVAQVSDDGREEEGEGVEGAVGAHVDDHETPRLPVFDCRPEVGHFEVLVLGGRLLVLLQPAEDAGAIVVGEEFGFVGEVVDHPVGCDADENGRQSFEDENPCPSRFPAYTVHLSNGRGEETTERASDCGSGEEDGCSNAKLGSFVPAG